MSLLERLKKTVEDSNITQVAKKIKVSRTTLSLVINNKYPANPQKILEQFGRAYSDVNCPYSGKTITREECTGRANAPRPSGGATKTAWWDACQNCPHKGG